MSPSTASPRASLCLPCVLSLNLSLSLSLGLSLGLSSRVAHGASPRPAAHQLCLVQGQVAAEITRSRDLGTSLLSVILVFQKMGHVSPASPALVALNVALATELYTTAASLQPWEVQSRVETYCLAYGMAGLLALYQLPSAIESWDTASKPSARTSHRLQSQKRLPLVR